MQKILVTGVTGQDGSYLSEFLVLSGFEVYGLVRRSASPNFWRISHLIGKSNFHLMNGDVTDLGSIIRILKEVEPDRIYNLAAQSFVGISWKEPHHTILTTGMGAVNIFEAVKLTGIETRIFQASSSEMFGNVELQKSITLETPLSARSPYGAAKILAHHAAKVYRDQGLFISCGISFNHESSRRGIEFVTRKITWEGSRVKRGFQKSVQLGNIKSKRDWGHASDYAYGFFLSLEHDKPNDYIFATGEVHSIEEFTKLAAKTIGNFVCDSVESEERPSDINWLCGDASFAEEVLGWKRKFSFEQLVTKMAWADSERIVPDQLMDAFYMSDYL